MVSECASDERAMSEIIPDEKLTKTSAIEEHFAAGSAIPLDGPPACTQHQNEPDGDIHPSESAWGRRQERVVFDRVVNGLGRDWRFPENVVVGDPVGECRPWVQKSAGQ